jgi:hypothetical protein
MTASASGGLSKLFVPYGIKNQAVASRFGNTEGNESPKQLIEIAQFDKTSVGYDTILDCNAIEDELLCYNRNWF